MRVREGAEFSRSASPRRLKYDTKAICRTLCRRQSFPCLGPLERVTYVDDMSGRGRPGQGFCFSKATLFQRHTFIFIDTSENC